MFRKCKFLPIFLAVCALPLYAETASEFADRADESFSKRDYRSAVHYYRKSLEKNPSYIRSLIGSGRSYLLIGDADRAEGYFRKTLDLESGNTDAMTGMGRLNTNRGKFKEAYDYLNRVIEIDPGNVDANYSMGEYHIAVGKIQPAEAYFKKVLRLKPDHQNALLSLCKIEIGRGRTDEAERFLLKARDVDPSRFEFHVARSLLDLKKAQLTEDDFDRNEYLNSSRDSALTALELSPSDLSLHKMTIGIDLMQNRIDDARKKVEGLLTDFSEDSEINYLAAALHRAYSDEPEKISQFYAKAMRLDPLNSLIRFAYEEFVLANESDFFAAGGIRRNLAGHHFRLFENYIKNGRPMSAENHLLRSLDLFPEDERALLERMERYRIDGDYESYLDELSALSHRNPDNRSLRFRLENILKNKNEIMPFKQRLFSPDVNPQTATFKRTPTNIFVFDLEPENDSFSYPDASIQISRNIIVYMGKPGRVRAVQKKFRDGVLETIRKSEKSGMKDLLFGTYFRPHYIPYIEQRESESIRVGYIVYGTYLLRPGGFSVSLKIIDKKSSRIVDEFRLTASGSDALHEIAISAAERINLLPFSGRVIKTGPSGIYINMGRVDGVVKGGVFLLEDPSKKGVRKIRITDTDYYISQAEPVGSEWTEFSKDEVVTPE